MNEKNLWNMQEHPVCCHNDSELHDSLFPTSVCACFSFKPNYSLQFHLSESSHELLLLALHCLPFISTSLHQKCSCDSWVGAAELCPFPMDANCAKVRMFTGTSSPSWLILRFGYSTGTPSAVSCTKSRTYSPERLELVMRAWGWESSWLVAFQ